MVLGGVKNRIFGVGSRVQIDLNFLVIGRYAGGQSGLLHTVRRIRTGFFKGHFTTGNVPNEFFRAGMPSEFPQFPEGVDIVFPYIKESPGYRLFVSLPATKLKIMENQLQEMKIYLANIIQSATMYTPEQLKEELMGVVDILDKMQTRGTLKLERPLPIEKFD